MTLEANFLELVWWLLAPLVIFFGIWALQDCLRSTMISGPRKFGLCMAIVLIPIWGGVIWFRWKDRRHADESDLMRRVMKRRGMRD